MTPLPLYIIAGGLVVLLVSAAVTVVYTAWKWLDKPTKRVRR